MGRYFISVLFGVLIYFLAKSNPEMAIALIAFFVMLFLLTLTEGLKYGIEELEKARMENEEN